LWPFPEFADHRGRALAVGSLLRLAIEFADGRSVTNFNHPPSGPMRRIWIARC
jgi:hypothetical protein